MIKFMILFHYENMFTLIPDLAVMLITFKNRNTEKVR